MAGGFKEFANTKDVKVLRPTGDTAASRRCTSTTRTCSTATRSRSICAPATPSSFREPGADGELERLS